MSSPSRFLTLPGEIRNHIYLHVALDAPVIRMFEGRVVLPPPASACRQIRKEMNGKYQRDATLNPETPVHARVTNFNFYSLSRWLDKHSRDLEDSFETPRVLCITSVLLAPDAAANCSAPKDLPKPKAVTLDTAPETNRRTRFVKPKAAPGARPQFRLEPRAFSRERVSSGPYSAGREAYQRTTSDEYENSLRVLRLSLKAWCRTWTTCQSFDTMKRADYRNSGIDELDSAFFHGQAERSGTNYVLGWRAQIVHREHPKARADDPHGLQRTGICYRGDFCDRFMFLHLRRIIGRFPHHSRSRKNIVEWLQYAMSAAHFNGLHRPHNSFQPARADDGKGELSDRRLEHCDPCEKVIRFYQSLDGYNIANRVFEQEVGGSRFLYRDWSSKRLRGTKRALLDDSDIELPDWNKRRKVGDWDENGRRLAFELRQMICAMGHLSLSDY